MTGERASGDRFRSVWFWLFVALMVPLIVAGLVGLLRLAGYAVMVNPSPSEPVGFYLIDYRITEPLRGALVAFLPDSWQGRYAYQKGWIRSGAPYLKRVYGVAGDRVCVAAGGVSVAGVKVGNVSAKDRHGVPLPHAISGCIVVPSGRFFPIGDGDENSYDGRYFGTVSDRQIQGQVRPLWVFR